ncbi:MAG: leucyl aminopeptidase family protein [Defluviitaleaceae bacterium]|nr:leucyl aminopeptidase family protein [Defluviitaleaceae bacterium]
MMVAFWNNESYDWKIEFTFDEKTNVHRKAGLKLTALPDTRTMQVGLGRRDDINALVIKRGIASAVSELKKIGARSVLVVAFEIAQMLEGKGLFPMVMGARLALYEPPSYKRENGKNGDAEPFSIYMGSEQFPGEIVDLREANILADNVLIARELVNAPANMLTPRVMAERVAEYCDKHGVHCEVFDENFITRQKMGAFLAVGSSSGNMPRLIVIRHMGDPENPGDITAIIGKALTFDTGGYNLKSSAGMKDMKCDMGGGAAAFAALAALAQNKVKANVIAVIPTAENRISRESFLPGDVLRTMSGRTVEIISTDAEGRLCMSDAMTYAIQNENATRLIDIATLTGAAVQALGWKTAATMTNHDGFYASFLKAAKSSGEQYWLMPSHDEYYLMIEGQIADLKNAPEDGCGIMAAGLFMEHFAEGLPWIHIDIAGTAFGTKPGYEFQKPGATGAGVETLYALFANRE